MFHKLGRWKGQQVSKDFNSWSQWPCRFCLSVKWKTRFDLLMMWWHTFWANVDFNALKLPLFIYIPGSLFIVLSSVYTTVIIFTKEKNYIKYWCSLYLGFKSKIRRNGYNTKEALRLFPQNVNISKWLAQIREGYEILLFMKQDHGPELCISNFTLL